MKVAKQKSFQQMEIELDIKNLTFQKSIIELQIQSKKIELLEIKKEIIR